MFQTSASLVKRDRLKPRGSIYSLYVGRTIKRSNFYLSKDKQGNQTCDAQQRLGFRKKSELGSCSKGG
jgi:hypothetical protein